MKVRMRTTAAGPDRVCLAGKEYDLPDELAQQWIKAGAACLGIGSKLIRKDLVAAGDYAAIRDNVHRVLDWVREAREQ